MSDDTVYLKVIDNGIGVSAQDIIENKNQSGRLGLTIMELLAMQLKATLEILPLTKGGTIAILQFVPQTQTNIHN